LSEKIVARSSKLDEMHKHSYACTIIGPERVILCLQLITHTLILVLAPLPMHSVNVRYEKSASRRVVREHSQVKMDVTKVIAHMMLR
jgi:hypothetical protein